MLGFSFKRNSHLTSNGHSGNGGRPLIDLRDVIKIYESAAGKFTALKGIDLHINAGEFVTTLALAGSARVVGKSGCGTLRARSST